MPRFQASQTPIFDSAAKTKRGERVTRGLKKLLLKGVNMSGVVSGSSPAWRIFTYLTNAYFIANLVLRFQNINE